MDNYILICPLCEKNDKIEKASSIINFIPLAKVTIELLKVTGLGIILSLEVELSSIRVSVPLSWIVPVPVVSSIERIHVLFTPELIRINAEPKPLTISVLIIWHPSPLIISKGL